MPDLLDRSERERAVFEKLGPVFVKQAKKVQRDADKRNPTDWDTFGLAVSAALLPTLAGTYETAGRTLAGQLQLGGLEKGLRQGSKEWSKTRALEVGQGVIQTSRDRLKVAGAEIDHQVESRRAQREREGLPMTALEAEMISRSLWEPKLESIFGPARVESIAITEITGSATAGEEETTSVVKVALGLAALALFFAGAEALASPAEIGRGTLAGLDPSGELVARGVEEGKKLALEKAKTELAKRAESREIVKRYGSKTVTDAAEGLEERGLSDRVAVKVWITEADGRVCPICAPLHRKPMAEWPGLLRDVRVSKRPIPNSQINRIMLQGGPAAHPNCRCFTETKLMPADVRNVA